MSGLIVAIIDFELNINCVNNGTCRDLGQITEDDNAMDDERYKMSRERLMRWFTMITSLISIVCLFIRQYFKSKWFKIFNKWQPNNQLISIDRFYNDKSQIN